MKPITRNELAQLYGYNSTKTFTRRLAEKAVPVTPRKLWSASEQVIVFAYLGIPPLLPPELQTIFQPLVKQYREQYDLA